jgi:hypothetical protein
MHALLSPHAEMAEISLSVKTTLADSQKGDAVVAATIALAPCRRVSITRAPYSHVAWLPLLDVPFCPQRHHHLDVCGSAGQTCSQEKEDWVCIPCAVVVPASPSGSPLHTHRWQRREGLWRSR